MEKLLRKAFRGIITTTNKLGLGNFLRKYSLISKIEKRISCQITPEFMVLGKHKVYLDKFDALRLSTFGDLYLNSNERQIYAKHIKKGDVVIDVGAFIGDNTLEFANLVGQRGKVYSFEPDEELFNLLKKNIIENGYTNVRIFNKAVTDKNGLVTFFYSPTRATGSKAYNKDIYNNSISWKSKVLGSINLDSIVKGKVDFIKIDTEGSEPLVIKGAQRIIKQNKNLKILLEFSASLTNTFGVNPIDYLTKFKKQGFRIYNTEDQKEILDLISFVNKYYFYQLNLFLIREGKKCLEN